MAAKRPNTTRQRGTSSDSSSSSRRTQPSFKARRQRASDAPSSCSVRVVDRLGPTDVVLGRDLVAQTHIGNAAFRRIVDVFQGLYRGTTSQPDRARIGASVALIVKESGGRFVRVGKSSGTWEEVEAKDAIVKIRQALNKKRSASALTLLPPIDEFPANEETAAFHSLLKAQRAMFSALLEEEEK